jgi:hypothetical protein
LRYIHHAEPARFIRDPCIKQGEEFAILTNLIHQEWAGVSVEKHKTMKSLKTQNLRDHMSEQPVGLWNRRLQSPGGYKRETDRSGPFFTGFLPHRMTMRWRIRQQMGSLGPVFAIDDQSPTGCEAELIFTALAELSTRQIAETDEATGMLENAAAAGKGVAIAKQARKALEEKTGKSVVTGENFLPPAKGSRRNQLKDIEST